MRFLVDANMPRSAAACIRECGHEAVDVRDIGLGQAPDRIISQYAQQKGLTLITPTKILVTCAIIRRRITPASSCSICGMTR